MKKILFSKHVVDKLRTGKFVPTLKIDKSLIRKVVKLESIEVEEDEVLKAIGGMIKPTNLL